MNKLYTSNYEDMCSIDVRITMILFLDLICLPNITNYYLHVYDEYRIGNTFSFILVWLVV